MKKGFLKSLVNFMFDAKVALSELTLEDGTLIQVDDETMMAYRVLEDGSEELLAEGEYTLMDGSKLVIDAEGKIVPQVTEEAPSEEIIDESGVEAEEVSAEQFSALQNEKVELAAQVVKLTEELEKLNKEYQTLLKTSVEKFKSIEKNVIEKPLSKLEAIKLNLKNNLNK
jgi:hypothetical protein